MLWSGTLLQHAWFSWTRAIYFYANPRIQGYKITLGTLLPYVIFTLGFRRLLEPIRRLRHFLASCCWRATGTAPFPPFLGQILPYGGARGLNALL